MSQNAARRICYPPPFTTADRAAELLAATSALEYVRSARAAAAAPEADRLTSRIRGMVTAIIAGQNQDGGWPWVSGESTPRHGQNAPAAPQSDRLASAAVVWALASTEPLGLLSDGKVLDQAVAFLTGEFAKLSGNDLETRAALLHALSTRRAASFEAANSLNRMRRTLSDPALAYLALTFANLDRASLAGELLGILGPRAKAEPTAPGRPSRIYWDSARASQTVRGAAEDGRPVHSASCPMYDLERPAELGAAPLPGFWPTASALAGGRIKPKGRRSLRWLPTTRRHSSRKTGTS